MAEAIAPNYGQLRAQDLANVELSRHGEKTLDALLEAAAPKLAAYKAAPWTDLVHQFWDRFGWDIAAGIVLLNVT